MKAICLCSGGLDSTTAIAIAKNLGFELYLLTFDYGQRHKIELEKAKQVAKFFNAKEHLVISFDLRRIGGSSLTSEQEVPKDNDFSQIPSTYVPARNIIFLSFALSWGEVLDIYDIFIGVNAIDYSGYPDCREDFINAFITMANLGTKAGVMGKKFKIHTPLIKLTKAEIIKKGIELGVDYSITHSCYSPLENGLSCGKCHSCILRLKGFKEAGVSDPLKYVI